MQQPAMNNSQSMSLKEDFKNLVKAIYALLPSRNRISQLLMFLPLKKEVVDMLFPEITKDVDYWDVLKEVLGLYEDSYGNLNYRYSGLGSLLRYFIQQLFEILKADITRGAISSLVGESKPLPNPEREWLELRVKAVLESPMLGDIARGVLALLSVTPSTSIEELSKKLNVEKQRVEQCIYVLFNLKLVETTEDGRVWLPRYIQEKYLSHIKRLLEEVKKND